MTVAARPLDERRRRFAIIAWAIVSLAVVAAVSVLPWRDALAAFGKASALWIGAACALNALPLVLWAIEWRLMLPQPASISLGLMFGIVSVSAMVLNTIPFLAGEASAIALLITRGGLNPAAAASVLAMDQLLVGFGKIVVVGAAAAASPLPPWLRAGAATLALVVSAVAALLIGVAHGTRALARPVVGRPLLESARVAIAAFAAQLGALRDPARFLRLTALAIGKKGAELAAIIAVQAAFGLAPSPGIALMVLAALSLTTLLPIAPANLGVYEATVFAAYRFAGVPADMALGIAVAQHMAFLIPAIGVGYVIMTRRQLGLIRPRGR